MKTLGLMLNRFDNNCIIISLVSDISETITNLISKY